MHAQQDQDGIETLTASHSRAVAGALAVAAWAAASAAIIAGRHLGLGAAVQIPFAAAMAVFATDEILRAPARPAILGDLASLRSAGRYRRLGAFALAAGVLLGPAAAGAVLGTDWRTTLCTTLAVACAGVSVIAHRLSRHLPARAGRRSPGVRRVVAGMAASAAPAPARSSRTPVM